MYKLRIAIKKEVTQLLHDKVGLSLMFIMPLILVVTITVIQDGAFKIVNENKVSVLISNEDNGTKGEELVAALEASKMFLITKKKLPKAAMSDFQLDARLLTGIHIPSTFSENIAYTAATRGNTLLVDLGLEPDSLNFSKSNEVITFIHDPALQENFVSSLKGAVLSQLAQIENTALIEKIYVAMGVNYSTEAVRQAYLQDQNQIETMVAANDNFNIVPNATQHNVPAWTIFAVFFMVVSLGGNIVREKTNGSFVRLKTFPTSFSLILFSKMLVYQMMAILQVILIFSVGVFVLPLLGLPRLMIPGNPFILILFVLVVSFSAVSYSIMIGAIAKTQEQSSGFGALSIVIFAALGGIWVPVFVMPEIMRIISTFSPLYWCLQGFYQIFLVGGGLQSIAKIVLFLSLFSLVCLAVASIKLKTEKLI